MTVKVDVAKVREILEKRRQLRDGPPRPREPTQAEIVDRLILRLLRDGLGWIAARQRAHEILGISKPERP